MVWNARWDFWAKTERSLIHSVDLSRREPGVWSLPAALLSSFVSRRAGNWTWNPSPRYLGDRLSSLLKWTHYDVRDEWCMSLTLSVYISISPSLPTPRLFSEQVASGPDAFFNPFRTSQFSWGPGVSVFCERVFFKNMCAACCCFSLHQAPRGVIEGRSCCGKRGHLRVTATVRVALLCFHQLHSRKSHQLGTGSNMEARVQGCVCAFDSNGERKW